MNGPEVYATIFSVGPGKRDVNVIWTGSDDGLVHVTRDGGKTWTNVTPKDMPSYGRVSQIDASSFASGTAYISVRRPLLDDFKPYIWKTADYGRTWILIVSGIRPEAYVHAVREDPTRRACSMPRPSTASTYPTTTAAPGSRSANCPMFRWRI